MSSSVPALPSGVTVFERGWLSSNNILITGGGGPAALVDSGYWTHSAQTVGLVRSSLGDRPLDLLVNTHLHSDHCGGNAALQADQPGLETGIPPGEALAVAVWDEQALSFLGTGQHCPRFGYDRLLTPDTELPMGQHRWEVHAAPGHDPHSVILFEPNSRALISADALWEHGFGVVFPELFGEPGFDDVAATFDLIERLAPAVVVPGHGAVFLDATGALATARKRLEGQARSPAKHAWHALKVLAKFKLLELGSASRADLAAWFERTAYLRRVKSAFFASQDQTELFERLLAELVAAGAAALDGDRVSNG